VATSISSDRTQRKTAAHDPETGQVQNIVTETDSEDASVRNRLVTACCAADEEVRGLCRLRAALLRGGAALDAPPLIRVERELALARISQASLEDALGLLKSGGGLTS
jgi:hypothetical protein